MSVKTTEYVGVMRLAGCFAAVHSKDTEINFISNHLEETMAIASESAKTYALQNKITLISDCQIPQEPILTIIRHGTLWYPAQIFSDRVKVLDKFLNPYNTNQKAELGLHYEGALSVAQTMANINQWSFIRSIGESFSKITKK